MKALQLFSDEYLRRCSRLSTAEILQFLEDYRQTIGLLHCRKPPAVARPHNPTQTVTASD